MIGALEDHFQQIETRLTELEKEAAGLRKAVTTARRAAHQGGAAELTRGLEQGRARAECLHQQLAALGEASFDYAAYLDSPAYVEELKAAAGDAGLVLVDQDGRLTAFPFLIKIDAKAGAVRINRKPVRHVRPGFLAAFLKAAQGRRSGFRSEDFLRALFGAYQRLSPQFGAAYGPQSTDLGPVVPLAVVHETLTLLPGAARDYPLEAFGRDLLLLDRAPDLKTPSGHGFRLPASTGTRSARRLVVHDEAGAQHLYVGLQFTGP